MRLFHDKFYFFDGGKRRINKILNYFWRNIVNGVYFPAITDVIQGRN